MRTLIIAIAILSLACAGCGVIENWGKKRPTPAPTVTPTPTPAPIEIGRLPTEPGETITSEYGWRFDGRRWTLTLHVPEALYDYYADRPRLPTTDYSVYVTHPTDDAHMEVLASQMEEAAATYELTELQTVNLAISFVQSLPYTSDNVTTAYDEYPRYPIETLVDNGGDCEDTSILLAALLHQMGYGVVLLSPPDHMGVGVLGSPGMTGAYWEHGGGRYYYVETTGRGWELGEMPPEYAGEAAYIYDIVPVPVLTHHWEATTKDYRSVKLDVTVENLGTGLALDAHIVAGFDAGESKVWNAEESAHFDLPSGTKRTITLNLTAPRGEHTRIIVQVVHGGYAVDDSYSEWFDT